MKKIYLWLMITVCLAGAAYYLVSHKNIPFISKPQNYTPEQNQIILTPDGFTPPSLTVPAGTTVTFTNQSGELGNVSSDPHPVHTDYPPLNLGSFNNGASVNLVFDKPGSYKFHNHLNPNQTGTITVE